MTSTLHCTTYDDALQTSVKHLSSYPQYLPFIGHQWDRQDTRVLFIAESHYLPELSNGKSSSQTWYDGLSSQLTPQERGWINTRGVVHTADHYAVNKVNFANGHSIFYNIKNAVFEALQVANKSQTMFQHFGYYNYFQRPAEVTGKTIQTSGSDNRIAYNTIKAIALTTQPTALVFVSKKAYISFKYWCRQENDMAFENIRSYCVPHPASAWWNKTSNAHGNITGRAKFINIIKELNLQLPLTA